jgi:hypothetical protein
MKLYRHKTPITTIADLFRLYFDSNGYQSNDRLLFLVDLVQFFRPDNPKKESIVSIKSLLDYLEANPDMMAQLQLYLAEVLSQRKFGRMLTDTVILRYSDFCY